LISKEENISREVLRSSQTGSHERTTAEEAVPEVSTFENEMDESIGRVPMTTVAKRDQTVVALMSSGASAASIGFAIGSGSYSSYVKLSEEQSLFHTLVHLSLEPEFDGADTETRKFERPSLFAMFV
jgi:hypothetical protein